MTRNLFVLLLIFIARAPSLKAQESRAWPERVFLTVDVPIQVLNNDFSESLRFADTVRPTENVSFDAAYPSVRGAMFDVGAGVRATRNAGVGVTASLFDRTSTASFTLAVPNPLVAGDPLDLSGSALRLRHREFALHIQALYALGLGNRTRLILSGGPSIFNTTQDLLRSVDVTILPGFRSLELNDPITKRVQKTVAGWNVGANVTWTVAGHIALGTVTRYARGNLTLDPGATSSLNREVRTHAGGLHIGAGIRLLF